MRKKKNERNITLLDKVTTHLRVYHFTYSKHDKTSSGSGLKIFGETSWRNEQCGTIVVL